MCVRGEEDHKGWLLLSGSERLQCASVNTPYTSTHTHTYTHSITHSVLIGNMCYFVLSHKTFSSLTQRGDKTEPLTDRQNLFLNAADWMDLLRVGTERPGKCMSVCGVRRFVA